eukprot:Skav210744  [mRNA]  locus=scaffold2652:307006:311116:+ [translate_table: standard]
MTTADRILAQPELLRPLGATRCVGLRRLDKNLMKQVLGRQGQLLRLASEEVRADPELVLTAVVNDGDALQPPAGEGGGLPGPEDETTRRTCGDF